MTAGEVYRHKFSSTPFSCKHNVFCSAIQLLPDKLWNLILETLPYCCLVSILLVVVFCPRLSRPRRVHAVGQWCFLELSDHNGACLPSPQHHCLFCKRIRIRSNREILQEQWCCYSRVVWEEHKTSWTQLGYDVKAIKNSDIFKTREFEPSL